jgi:hypothetical protein
VFGLSSPCRPVVTTSRQRPSHPLPRSQKAETGRYPQKTGGGGGIRTLDTVSRIQHFQCCAFSHSATPPTTNPAAKAELTRISAYPPTGHSKTQWPKRSGQTRWPAFTGPDRPPYPAGPAKLAVRVGFEPTVQLPVHRFSRPTDSATLAPHQNFSKPPFTLWSGCGAAEKNHGADRHTLQLEPHPSPAGGG